MRTPTIVCLLAATAAHGLPLDNPVKAFREGRYGVWTDSIRWTNVVSVADAAGSSADERFAAARDAVAAAGGGVVYFPAGVYTFTNDLTLVDGVVIRGAAPVGPASARDAGYTLPTRFEFPRYVPRFEGDGTPNSTAFKNIRCAKPATDSNCGVVHVAINRAHIFMDEVQEGHRCGRNRIVFGCILRNTAAADPAIPMARLGQKPWQRYTQRHRAAIHVQSQENLLVANNRIPESGDANFLMKDYAVVRMKGSPVIGFNPEKDDWSPFVIEEGVLFDYDNRPGIYANDHAIGTVGDGLPNGTPETHPQGFRKGTEIVGNYIFSHGRCPIAFSGDGTVCSFNEIHIPPGIWRPTCRGYELSSDGSATNDNRAIQCRGRRYTVEGNVYEVHSNLTFSRTMRTGDGEGIMHENHVNSAVQDSRIVGNRGNAYICLWRVAVDGLEIRDNEIRLGGDESIPGGSAAIYVLGRKRSVKGPDGEPLWCEVKRCRIVGNKVSRGGIRLTGRPCEGNVIRNNIALDDGCPIEVLGEADVADNTGFAAPAVKAAGPQGPEKPAT